MARSVETIIDGVRTRQFSYRFGEGLVWVYVADRPDGGIRVYSDDVPGLILSGKDRVKVMSDIPVALEALSKWL